MAMAFVNSASWATGGTLDAGNGSYKDITFTGVAVGDMLVVTGASEGYDYSGGTRVVTTTAGTTGAWTLGSPAPTFNNDTDAVAAYAIASSAGTITVRVTLRVSTSGYMGVSGFLIPAAEFTGAPSFVTFVADADGQASTVVGATSIVIYLGADWTAAQMGAAFTPAGATGRVNYFDGTHYSVGVASWTGQTAGTRAYGPSGLTGRDITGGILVIPEASGSTSATVTAVPATATALASPAVVTAGAAVVAVTATATATAYAAVVAGSPAGDVTVVAVTATATATAYGAVISAETVIASSGPATATAMAHPATIDGGAVLVDGVVLAVTATASAVAHAASVTAIRNAAVSAAVATASAAAYAAAVDVVYGDGSVLAVTATASAVAHPAVVDGWSLEVVSHDLALALIARALRRTRRRVYIDPDWERHHGRIRDRGLRWYGG